MTKLSPLAAAIILLLSGCATPPSVDVKPSEECEVMAADLKTDWTG